ncbi:amino acid adenylation domain-containing protein [Streptomyces goshikiensis]|uniref:amino acid adenylation domain-containing protein n=2 Tax=Streptomyces TaxID=1883 RepID=UPI000C274093|nr:non-ribosomal peptide synthetase [Streptomyces sp. CB02120-2]PJN19633.1 non-ribosomal peptide synthetase [Streptomyces sp. CB02120-2]
MSASQSEATATSGPDDEAAGQDFYVFPASRAQKRMYFLQELAGDASTYHVPLFYTLTGAVDEQALREAAQGLVDRHEALRTRFAVRDGELLQLVSPESRVEWRVEDVADDDAAVERWVRRESERPFDLLAGPLFRVALLRRSARKSVLLVDTHHIVTDGWSTGIILAELSRGYASRVAGAPDGQEPPEVQYADYSAWQDEWLDSAAAHRQERYWQERLAGELPLLELPTPRPRRQDAPGPGAAGIHVFPLPGRAVDTLRGLCLEAGGTLFMGLLAAFDVLLNRYTGLDDILVGTPIANRNREEFENTVGLFVNTTVFRSDLSADPTFRELLGQVRDRVLEAQDHQDLPFERLVEMKNPERGAAASPVFQVMFGMNRAGDLSWTLPGVEVEWLPTPLSRAKFDLLLDATDGPEGVECSFEYRADLFGEQTIGLLAEHLAVLVGSIAAGPDLPVSRLRLLTGPELARQAPPPPPAEDRTAAPAPCHERFGQWAARTPDAVAVVDGDTHLTFGRLEARANQLAHHLKAAGVGPGHLVGLSVNRSADLVVAILGILKAGGCYVPFDPAYPAERLRFMAEDSGVSTLLAGEGVPVWWDGSTARVVDLAAEAAAIAAQPRTAPAVEVSGDDLAYVIYTSGSTGRPKGTLIPHRNIARLFSATDHWFGFGPQDVWTLFHSYAFDFSVWELWGALAHGGRLVVVPYETSRDPEAFHRLLRTERVTVLNQTPSAFYQLMRADKEAQSAPPAPLALRLVVFGGEALDLPALRDWFERHGDTAPRLVNMYGITETTVHVTYRPITLRDLDEGRGSVIGTPIPDLRLYVLDRHGRGVPTGVPGELYVGGAGLADGYLNRPELTAERFVPAPFAGHGGERLYRTGDLVRLLHDGDLEYCGRIDRQVKLRGFRIELGDIEAALSSHPDVVDSVVLLRTDAAGHPQLAAYAAAPAKATAPAPDAHALRAHLAALLPEHMVPASYTVLPAFPLTANGKVDRAALPEPRGAQGPSPAEHTPPRTPVERALADIWSEVLGQRVGIDDGYFALGGDSIRSIRLLALAREAGLDFKLTDLMTRQTIRSLAEAVTPTAPREGPERRREPFALLSPADRTLLPDGLDDAYPMTRTQLGMLFHSGLSADGTAEYHNTSTYRIRARWDVAAWRAAVSETIGRHDILRTSFDLHSLSEPAQLVHRDVEPPVTFEELDHLGPEARRAAVEARTAREARQPFDWQRAPLIRFHVQRLTDDTLQLFITEHHAILDGWSERSLFAELLLRHAAALAGTGRPDTTPPASRFADFVALETAALADRDTAAYWEAELDGASLTRLPRPALPPGRTGPAAMGFHESPLDPEVTAALPGLAARLGVPLRCVLLAAHLRVLSLLSGADDVVTGVVYNGRGEERDADLTLGVFLNTLPFRGRLTGGSWTELIERTARQDIAVQPHRRYPLPEIMRRTGGSELFESFFNYTRFHVENTLAGQSEVVVLEAEGSAPTHFPFGAEFAVGGADDHLTLGLRYDTGQFHEEQIAAFHGHYAAVLAAMAGDPEGSHEDADLLPAAEHERIAAWNATAVTYDRPHVLHALIGEQVRLRPDAPAVRHEGEELSYRALDERAGRLAVALRAHGVARGQFVGLHMERSLDLSVALLAVLKAGAAYVPLDPDHPDLRLRQVLGAAGISVVLAAGPGASRLDGVPGITVVRAEAGQDPAEGAEAAEGTPAPVPAAPEDPAYMIFTSGSTGTPKGVVVSHRAICNRLLWMQQEYGLEVGERVLHKTPYTFDVSVWELFWPLLAGATLVHARPGGHRDPAYLARLVGAERITTAHFVPSMLQAFVEEPLARGCTGLTRVICSGEALPYDLQTRFFSVLGAELHNLYGPTEAAVDVTAWRCRDDGRTVVPIGRPIANMQTHVLDRRGHAVPVGVTGELHLSGVGLADGYHGRPDLTARSFIHHTDRRGVRRRMYRTGDLARWLADGTLEYRGRTDSQVKLRGFRIELQEIEAVLAGHPAVAECAVVLRQDRLVGYVVPAAGADRDPADTAGYLRERLPAYMVPTAWVRIDAMPLTASGKLDRKALPEPPAATPARADGPASQPSDAHEERLLRLWRRLLDAADLGVHDDFFALGGHSLLAVRLVSLINAEFGGELGVAAVLEHPTIAGQAALLKREPGAAGGSADVVTMRGRGRRIPLFLVHPVGGGVTCYREVSAALGDEQPVYALPAPALAEGGAPPASVGALAEHCLRAVRAVRPEGPYAVGGWSFGGLVAHEMACRLADEGEDVALLAMIDSGFPQGGPLPEEPELLRAFAVDVLGSAGRDPDAALPADAAAHARAGRVDEALDALARHLDAGATPADGEADTLPGTRLGRHYEVFRTNLRLAAAHRPRPYTGAVRFYQGTDGARTGSAASWAPWTPGPVVLRELKADHYDIMRAPHVKAVADDLGAALADATEATDATDAVDTARTSPTSH